MTDPSVRPAPRWTPPEPRQLPVLRMSVLEQLRTPQYQAEVATALGCGLGTIQPGWGTPEDKAALMLHDESTRLASATLWSVSDDMTRLAVQAGRKLPSWKLYRHDVPSPTGLVVYDTPIAEYVNTGDETVKIVAASWGPSTFLGAGDLWVTFWAVVDHDLIALAAKDRMGWSMAKARAFARQYKVSDLNWDNEVVMAFDDHRIRVADHGQVDPAAGRHLLSETTTSWAQTLRATWLLLKPSARKITEVEELHIPRTVARRQQRAGVTDTSRVNVVRVHSSRRRRRTGNSTDSAHHEGKLGVRFPVSGHIRWQPYPSRDTIEPIFIDTYDKGPEGAPYRVGKNYTVHRLDQPPT